MKKIGEFAGIAVYSDEDCPPDTMYMINPLYTLNKPKRKNGKPDMRYSINKLEEMFRKMIGY